MNKIVKTEVQNHVVSFVSEYEFCVRKTTASIIELADCVFRAKEQLSPAHFDEFCNEIQVDKNSSYLKKLNCIAQKASRFKIVEKDLPANYTTLYALTKVNDANFQKMCDEKVINPLMTAKQLNAYLDKKTTGKSIVYEVIFRLDSDKKSDEILECMNAFQEVAKKFNIKLKLTPDLTATLDKEVANKKVIESAVFSAVYDEVIEEKLAA